MVLLAIAYKYLIAFSRPESILKFPIFFVFMYYVVLPEDPDVTAVL